jgi:hypothetical protein
MTDQILTALYTYLNDVGRTLAHFLPRLLAALVLLIAGYLAATAARAATRALLRVVRFNALMERSGARQVIERAQLGEPDRLAGSFVFWFTWIVLLLLAARTLGVVAVDALAQDFIRYLPKLASAVLIVVLGAFLSTVAWRATLLAAVNARLPGAKLIGSLVRIVTIIAAIAMALEQLEIGRQVMLTAFAISFGAVMMTLSIAFGFGGRHAARRYIERRLSAHERDRQEPGDPASHL